MVATESHRAAIEKESTPDRMKLQYVGRKPDVTSVRTCVPFVTWSLISSGVLTLIASGNDIDQFN